MAKITLQVGICAVLALTTGAHAGPLHNPRIGGLTLNGPASAHPVSFYFNPATLSLLSGYHLYLDSSGRFRTGTAERQPISTTTGQPTTASAADAKVFSPESVDSLRPNFFLAGIADLGLESVNFALAVHTPIFDRLSVLSGTDDAFFDADEQSGSRYHGVQLALFQLQVSLAAAIDVADWLSVGVSMSYVFTRGSFAFARDDALDGGTFANLDDCGGGVPCGFENDAAAEAIRVRGTNNALGFSAGALFRIGRDWRIGLGYVSPLVGLSGDAVSLGGDAFIRRAQTVFAQASQQSPNFRRDLRGRGVLTLDIPDIISGGVTWRPHRRVILDFQLRMLPYVRHNQMVIRLSGQQLLEQPSPPDRIVHYRGFQNVYAAQLGARWRVSSRLELTGAAMYESSAVPKEAVTLTAIDNHKIDAFVAARIGIVAGFNINIGYGLVWMAPVTVNTSAFSSADFATCARNNFDLDNPACLGAIAGRGLAPSAGTYTLFTHRVSLGLAYDW